MICGCWFGFRFVGLLVVLVWLLLCVGGLDLFCFAWILSVVFGFLISVRLLCLCYCRDICVCLSERYGCLRLFVLVILGLVDYARLCVSIWVSVWVILLNLWDWLVCVG